MNDYRPTDRDIAALRAFAACYGRKWKSVLSQVYWPNARIWEDAGGDKSHGYILHGIRNNAGPTWLYAFRFPKATA